MACDWVMSARLGAVMFALYMVFVALDLMANFPVGDPIIQIKF